MIADESELETYLAGSRLAVVFFNKDARSLVRAHRAGIRPFPFTIEHVLDPTLRYRPRVRDLAAKVIDPARIAPDVATIEKLVRARAFDAVMIFETGYEAQLQDHLLAFEHDSELETLEDLDRKCQADFENYRRMDANAEFNARWSRHAVQFLTEWFSAEGLLVLNAYNALVETVQGMPERILAFTERHAILPTIPTGLADVPLRFVLGEDWACGKTSYLVDRMIGGASGLAGDFWFRLVASEAIPTFQTQDIFGIKGVIANLVRRAHERNPGKPVYVKYDGRLEEFIYGIPRDRTYLVKDMHHFFRDCRFVMVHKADSPRMRELVAEFMRKYEIGPDRVERVRMHPDGTAEDLGPPSGRAAGTDGVG